jgi:undecaprenyl-diphosphatase
LVRCGDARVGVAVLAIGCVAALRRRRSMRAVPLAIATAVVVEVVVAVLKPLIGRSGAPTAAHALVGVGGHGYPSGHTATAAVCWGLAAALVARAHPRLARVAWPVAGIAAIGTAAGMVYGPGHWLSDVVASLLLVGAALAAYAVLLRRIGAGAGPEPGADGR